MGGSSAYFSGFGVRRKSLLSKRGEFPTGLLFRVTSYFIDKDVQILDNREYKNLGADKIYSIKSKYPNAYEWQVKALEKAIHAGKGIISAPTGTGKSGVISMIAEFTGLKTLVVVPTLEIKKQLESSIKLNNCTIRNIDSKDLKTLKDFDILIIDEAHHSGAKTYQTLNKTAWTKITHRFFLSATPFRNDTEETLLFESICGQVIYKLDYKTAVKKGYIVPIEAYYIEVPKQKTDAYTWAEVYSQLVVNNRLRNTTIANILSGFYVLGTATLCLVKEVKHGEILSKLSTVPFTNGGDDESREYIRQFNKGDVKVLIGTTGILGEGVDTKPCEYAIIAGLGKAKSQFMQQVGRAVRKYPGKESAKIILFRDNSHKFLLRHFREQCKILKEEYGVIPIKLEL